MSLPRKGQPDTTRDGDRAPLLILGCGFLGLVLAQKVSFKGVPVIGTARGEPHISVIKTRGATAVRFEGGASIEADLSALDRIAGPVGKVVMSIPPEAELDAMLAERVKSWGLAPGRVLYISSTSVYGDHDGAEVTETTPPQPATDKAKARLAAEATWQAIGASVIRPAGIYGPGRSLLHRIAAKKHRLIDGGLTITNRIHVADLATLCEAALTKPPGVYLGSDLAPTTQVEVADWATAELGLPAATPMSMGEAKVRMDKDTLAMFSQSKRLNPAATLAKLGVTLRYPTYREGFRDVWMRDKAALMALVASS